MGTGCGLSAGTLLTLWVPSTLWLITPRPPDTRMRTSHWLGRSVAQLSVDSILKISDAFTTLIETNVKFVPHLGGQPFDRWAGLDAS